MLPPLLHLLIVLILSAHVSSYTLLQVQAPRQNCYLVCNCCSIGFRAAAVHLHFLSICQREITHPHPGSFQFFIPLKGHNSKDVIFQLF